MRLNLYTNFAIEGSCRRHVLELSVTCYRINIDKKELYVYIKNKGYHTLDTSKIYDMSTRVSGYNNHVTFNEGGFCNILPQKTTKNDLLKLLLSR